MTKIRFKVPFIYKGKLYKIGEEVSSPPLPKSIVIFFKEYSKKRPNAVEIIEEKKGKKNEY